MNPGRIHALAKVIISNDPYIPWSIAVAHATTMLRDEANYAPAARHRVMLARAHDIFAEHPELGWTGARGLAEEEQTERAIVADIALRDSQIALERRGRVLAMSTVPGGRAR